MAELPVKSQGAQPLASDWLFGRCVSGDVQAVVVCGGEDDFRIAAAENLSKRVLGAIGGKGAFATWCSHHVAGVGRGGERSSKE